MINSPHFIRQWQRSGLWLSLLTAVLLGGCASDKGLISHSFNNIAARDNAYFIAREKLRAIEATLYKARVNDYNAVLPLFPTLDSTAVQTNRAELNDIIKKASMPIQHRPGSDWTDDAYLVVAWARFYKMEFDDAALTFKYVNTTSKDANAKHEALIGLMRTFVATKQLDNAKAVSDLLDKETGRPDDARELFLTRADYYLKTENPAQAIAQLERAVPLIELKNERSRTRFILAQLYQEAGDNKKAYAQLNEILKRNPPYELDFQSKLMLGQVSELNAETQARLDKYFAGLLKDLKNKEYRDKIYYEMARVAYRRQDYPAALALLNKSARVPSRTRSQKSYTYLLAGRIYYENLRKYRLAAAYYDSTVQNLSKEAPTYAAIKERSETLAEFAKQYTIVETQDSLQALAQLPPAALDAKLNQFALVQLAAQKKEAERLAVLQKERARADELASRGSSSSSSNIGSNLPGALPGGQRDLPDPTAVASAAGGSWYFDNPAALSTARSEFQRRWGSRPLQDNWRTSNQSAPGAPQPGTPALANGQSPAGAPGQDPGSIGGAGGAASSAARPAPTPEAAQSALVAQLRQALPDTPEKLLASNVQTEAALYALGGIYKEQLKEPAKGYDTYARQVTRYPRGANAPDAYYLLYLHYKDLPDPAKAAEYAAALQREFPNSLYAKLIRDPQYREHELALHNAVAARVDSAFTFYKNQEFKRARAVLARTQAKYPKSDLSDRVAYLNTLLAIRTQPPLTARAAVEAFYKNYPESPLVPQAQALAGTYKRYESNQIAGALASTAKPVISMFRPGEVENRMRIFYGANETPYVAGASNVPAATTAPAAAAGIPTPPAATNPPASANPALSSPTRPAISPAAPVPTPSGQTNRRAPVGRGKPASETPATTTPTPTAPAPTAPANPASTPPTAPNAGNNPAATTPEPPAAPATAYTTQLSAMHAVVLVFPKGAPTAAELPAQFTAYNSRFFRDNKLQVESRPLDAAGQELVVVRPLPGAKVAQSYATKLRGPQSPVARLRGAGYQTLVISLENLALLQASGDLAGYLSFFQRTYK